MKSRTAIAAAAAVVAIVAVILVFASLTKPDSSGTAREAPEGQTTGESSGAELARAGVPRREPDDPLAMGEVDAPVVLIEYADFRCPYCAVFTNETMPALEKYIDNGTLRVEWRDFPVFGKQSMSAALAARAAGKQGKFWEFYKAVFADAPPRGHADLPPEKLLEYAEQIGVANMEKFKQDMDDPELAKSIRSDRDEAITLGMTGTPSFVLGDQFIIGAQPTSAFVDEIERQADS